MIHGKKQDGFNLSAKGKNTFKASNPCTLQELNEGFYCATDNEIEQTM